MSAERVQKILAQAGIASRRQAEEFIQDGLVTINGKVAKLGDKAEWGTDAIKVKGKLLQQPEVLTYMAFYKPKNVISALTDPEGRPCIGEYVQKLKTRVYPVGRLDFTSEGLILLTNDGNLAQKIQKSDTLIRVYYVKVKGYPTAEMLKRIEKGTGGDLDTKQRGFKPLSIKIKEKLQSKSLIEVVLVGGGAFNLKTLFESRGFLVEKISRFAIGHITAKGMSPGESRLLKESQVQALIDQPELGMKRLEHEWSRGGDEEPAEEPQIQPMDQLEPKTRKSFDDKPSGRGEKRSFGDKPAFGHSKRSFDDKPSFGGKEKRSFGDKPAFGRSKRSFDDKPSFGGKEKRSFGDKPAFGRSKRSFDDKPSFGGKEKRSFGDKPAFGRSKRSFDDKPSFGGKEKRSFGDKPAFGRSKRSFDDKPSFGGKEKRSFGDKPAFGRSKRSFDDKPSFGGKEKRSFGDKPAFGRSKRSFDDKPSFGGKRSSGDAKSSFGGGKKPFGGPKGKPKSRS
jgi:23S rRNA pseudouridine2605 synthase